MEMKQESPLDDVAPDYEEVGHGEWRGQMGLKGASEGM